MKKSNPYLVYFSVRERLCLSKIPNNFSTWFLPVAGPEVCFPWALAFISFQEIKTQSLHLTVMFSQAQCRRALPWQLQQNWGHRGYFGPALTESYAVWLWQCHDCPSGLWLRVSLSKLWAFGLIIFSFHILVPHTWYLASYPAHQYSNVRLPGWHWSKAYMCVQLSTLFFLSLSSPQIIPTTSSSNTH